VSLPRPDDRDAVPAWLELDGVPHGEPALWRAVASVAGTRDAAALVERAALLGLPVSRVGEASPAEHPGVLRQRTGEAAPRSVRGARVIDLSALWAGPLCGDLLAGLGADVIKVESTARPDGARRGPSAFFDLLNARKRSVVLDFSSSEGRGHLARLIGWADVVIEASRPRALAQLGIQAPAPGPQVWISLTGFGRSSPGARVAFGDDAAAAGGLVVWGAAGPAFCADAVGDPVSGLHAAQACLDALEAGGRWMLDVSMAHVSAQVAGPTLPVPAGLAVADPRARPATGVSPPAGVHTAQVLGELGELGVPGASRS
jgi:crotonobetainyl-CoA:carnitine CoA-transferase CaiB-like acyl-CoA transferase